MSLISKYIPRHARAFCLQSVVLSFAIQSLSNNYRGLLCSLPPTVSTSSGFNHKCKGYMKREQRVQAGQSRAEQSRAVRVDQGWGSVLPRVDEPVL